MPSRWAAMDRHGRSPKGLWLLEENVEKCGFQNGGIEWHRYNYIVFMTSYNPL